MTHLPLAPSLKFLRRGAEDEQEPSRLTDDFLDYSSAATRQQKRHPGMLFMVSAQAQINVSLPPSFSRRRSVCAVRMHSQPSKYLKWTGNASPRTNSSREGIRARFQLKRPRHKKMKGSSGCSGICPAPLTHFSHRFNSPRDC